MTARRCRLSDRIGDMALRWVRTIEEAPHMFSSSDNTESDWLLYCGGWLVGRVRKLATVRQDVFTWSLTGPHARIVSMRGDAATVQAAKESLIAAVRAWAAW